jgi:hypothetical protein
VFVRAFVSSVLACNALLLLAKWYLKSKIEAFRPLDDQVAV